ncbi:MBL fold metallo-hydrolase [Tumebacillus lipolyticus]|uniref:MBL fold metallo-hydrolase n=1 Tax=Tumebacillus lipolyticus TaxID=1280370 RepID=A0ABW5A1X9_9BACL
MRIANGVEMLEISANMMGKQSVICPTLLWDEQSAVLVDTGYPGQLPLIRQAMEQAGISFETLSKVILTHQDLDHIGSLPNILTESEQKIEVLANEIEKPFIQGEKRLLKITDEAIAQVDANFPPDVPEEWRNAFKRLLENPPHAQVDTIVVDGAELPDCGGITIIDTPGHTPGHISLYHQPSKTLIAGDAMVVRDGQLFGPDPQYTLDLDEAMRSLKKLTRYDIETVICYHGGAFGDQVNTRIAELAAGH